MGPTSIYQLRHGKEDVFRILTDEVVARQEREKIIFEQFLSQRELKKLNQAWSNYASASRTAAPGSLDKRPADITRALSLIDKVLSCARPK